MHKHLARSVKKVHEALDSGSIDVLTELQKLYEKCDDCLKEAQTTDDWQSKRAFISEARQILRVVGEVQGKIQNINIQMNVFNNPQISQIFNDILLALEPYPDALLACSNAMEARKK